jgi:hydrogenase-4 component B
MAVVPVNLLSVAISLFAVSGIPGLFLRPRSPWIARVHAIVAVSGSVLGILGAIWAFVSPDSALYVFPWPSAQNGLVGVDALSAFFLIPVFLIGALGAVYGIGYWSSAEHARNAGSVRFFWGLIIAGMALLVIARHALSFLLGWETMALSAFFLVTTEDEKPDCRKSGLIYLIATHVGTLALFGFFALWRAATGSFELTPTAAGSLSSVAVNVLVFLALFGFGLKAGIMPLHFWLPGAHANAPSHVSALLSGVMLKMGVYGIVRTLTLFPDIAPFWGWFILIAGAASGLLGVAFAIAQHDLKRLLAYHSVENIGIILLGLGMALVGRTYHREEWVTLGMAGCLLHVWNHCLFKALLFFGAGSVLHGTGTRQIDRLGGLAKKMPWTALFFLVGAVAICGLPPLNGFVSEFFVYLAFLGSALSSESLASVAPLGAPVLAMIGALAVACFAKVYGAVFLGTGRTDAALKAREAPASMLAPMAVLAVLCVVIGAFPALTAPILDKAIAVARGAGSPIPHAMPLASLVPFAALGSLMLPAAVATAALCAFFFWRARRVGQKAVTWDCGYARPTARVQYTAASFARSLVGLFGWALKSRTRVPRVSGPFPERSALESHVDDPVLDRQLLPEAAFLRSQVRWFNRFQQGQTQSYILYVVVALGLILATLIPFKRLFLSLFVR